VRDRRHAPSSVGGGLLEAFDRGHDLCSGIVRRVHAGEDRVDIHVGCECCNGEWHYSAGRTAPAGGGETKKDVHVDTCFITGTDTGCGKTTVTAALARRLAERGLRVACFKPIASGCEYVDGKLISDDALRLIDAMNVELPYERVNPCALAPPIAPHIAAQRAGIRLDPEGLCEGILQTVADVRLVEGVGGWSVPLDECTRLAALPARLRCPTILVVGMRLGCLNHALLSAEAIAADGIELAGWIANYLDPDFAEPAANEATLDRMLPAPRLGRMTGAPGALALELSDRLERLLGT